ncbi:uncharacterized protein LOC134279410 isoform X3 [Saccostrea cucullata]|uniref:uncharacterized protein LOC134279410 isoform X3 n=1 Tax=Saccostrea cuccullata TaxID=36930 RepID=UPI002ED513B2
MPRDDKGRFIKESRQKQREGLARGREKSKARKSGTVNISETPEEALVGIDHNYFDGDNGGDDTCQIAKEVVLSQEDEEKKDQWRMGRRVVDLGIIADGLKSCQLCGQPLHLSNCVSERKFGLAHVLIVKCNFPECGLLNEVPTGRKHKTTSGGYAWDVNTKLAAAMINEGLGETQVNGLLASLNIPTITQKSLKEREREVGNQLDLMAEESCRQHLRREIEMSEGNLSASFDGAWQKRGTGRAYNSLTGHASLFGEKTKKLIGYSVMAKKCRICAAAKVKGVPPRKHKCRVNWTGSAKAMEPAMACQMLKNVEDEGVKVTTLIMDNDSTTLSRVKASVNPNISKKSDSNHTKKGFTGSLIELSNQHKVLRNVKVRGHIERCFMYCIHQNQNREQQLKADFRNIVSHLYGEHHGCGSWCKSEKSNYKPRNLPYGKPLSCPILRKALEDLFEKYANKASELSALGSTQLNESFNQMVSSKAPKRLLIRS